MRRILLALALFAAVTLCSLRAQERLPELLLEQFTGERCPACPGGAKTIKSTINSMVSECRVSWIAHHAGYYTDFLTLPESQQLQHLFRIGGGTGTYAPAFMINRAKIDGTVVSKVRTDSIKKRVYKFLPAASGVAEIPAELELDFDDLLLHFDPEQRLLQVKASAKLLDNYSGGDNLYFNVAITESNIKTQGQAGGGSNYIHNHALRKFLSGVKGLKVDPQNPNAEWEVNIPQSWKLPDLRVIVFAHRDPGSSSSLPTDARVYASLEFPFPSSSTAISTVEDRELKVYAVEGNLVLSKAYKACKVYDLAGRLMPMSNLEPGVYVVRVETHTGIYTHKVRVS